MYKKIYNTIKKYNNIVIARHINGDPDALGSQIALRDSIKLTFPEKNVFAVGNVIAKFLHMGHLDSIIDLESLDDILLIVVDTPDKKRVDLIEQIPYKYSIKIDHHPYIETFCDIELINDKKSSASEMITDLLYETKLKINKKIAENLFKGIVADTNRFLFNNSSSDTFKNVSKLIGDYELDITTCYADLYRRSFSEMALLGFIASNMKITENGVGYVRVSNETLQKLNIDGASTGGIINEFNNVNELLIWTIAMEDVKSNLVKVSIRSRGPSINKTAEQFNGGGHSLASGARIPSFEEYDALIKKLDKVAESYIKECDENEDK